MLSTIQSNIKATLSDRVAVNHCVTERLKDSFNTDLLELHCNIHPLDSISSKARSALKDTGVNGALFGKDCAAANVIHNVSKMRYKQGSADPLHFKVFFKRSFNSVVYDTSVCGQQNAYRLSPRRYNFLYALSVD